jgi:hypothetical protein
MSKKHKQQKHVASPSRPNFVETHWEKFIIIVLIVLPLIYFAGFLNPNRMIAGSDYVIGSYPLKRWIAAQEEMPLWYSPIFAGVPVLGSPVGGPLAPLEQLRAVMPIHVVLAVTFIIMFILAGLGMYAYLRIIGLSAYAAAIGAVAYQFIGNLATTPMAGHAGRAASIALFPLMLFFIHRGLKTRQLLCFVFFALVTAFAFYEGHFQITYYGLLFVLAYAIFYLIARRNEYTRREVMRVIAYGLCAVAFICLLMAAVWLPVLGTLGTGARGVERGYEFATSWAMPPLETIDLVIPTYSGLLDSYWGLSHFKLHMEYFGLFGVIFALFAVIFFWKKPYTKFYIISTFVVLCIAFGGYTPVYRIFYTLIPGFKLMRAPNLSFYLVGFGFIVLAAIGFDSILVTSHDEKRPHFTKKYTIAALIIMAILLLTGIICTLGKTSIVQSMQDAFGSRFAAELGQRAAQAKLAKIATNFPAFTTGIWRTVVFAVLFIGLVYGYLKRKIPSWIVAVVAIIIALVDVLPLTVKFLPLLSSPETYYAADDAVQFIKKDKSIFRAFPTPWYDHAQDSYLLYHNIQSPGGYIANPVRRYQEFIGAGTSVMFSPTNLIQYPKFVDMLNVKYLIGPTLPEDVSMYDAQTQNIIRELRDYFGRYKRALTGRRYSVYENDSTLPRAYIVPDYLVEDTNALAVLTSPEFDPRKAVVLSRSPLVQHPDSQYPLRSVNIIEYSPNKVVCTTGCSYAGFLVLSDNWHPDWHVSVDGNEQELFRANHTFRAVYVPAGKHEVAFVYVSTYFRTGQVISVIALIAVVMVIALGLFIDSRRSRPQS